MHFTNLYKLWLLKSGNNIHKAQVSEDTQAHGPQALLQ